MMSNLIQVSPRWVMEPENSENLVGEGVALNCKARGTPTPKITWKKSRGEYLTLTKLMLYTEIKNNYI